MTMDLTGGLDPASDYPILDPGGRDIGENHAFWCLDRDGVCAILCCHLQAGATKGWARSTSGGRAVAQPSTWAERRESYTLVLPGKRFLVDWAVGDGTTAAGPGGAGWKFRCEKPFVRWTGKFRGTARDTTPAELQTGPVDLTTPRVRVECEFEADMAAPAWMYGTFPGDGPERERALSFVGNPKYEQLYRTHAKIRVDGEEYGFSGTGIRTHRYGARNTTGMAGHSWISALFPSGRAFGLKRFQNDDGSLIHGEAYVVQNESLVEARILAAPWLSTLQESGERFTMTLQTPDGTAQIEGETAATTYNMGLGINRAPGSPAMTHSMAHFTWNGERTTGHIERSARIERLVP